MSSADLSQAVQHARFSRVASSAAPRRVLFIDHTAILGGGEIALLNLVRCLDQSKYHPIVLLFSDGSLREKLEQERIETHLLPLAGEVVDTRKDSLGGSSLLKVSAAFAILSHVWKVARFIAKHRIDLVHTNSLKSDLIGGLAARLAGRPVIWHVRDRIDGDYLPPKVAAVFRALCRIIPTRLVSNSAATLATVMPSDAPSYAKVVHDGTELPDVQPAAPFQNPKTPVIGMIGRITRWKGQHVFLHACAEVHKQFPLARFRIIGAAMFQEMEYDREVRELARSLNLEDVVEFTGFRTDIPRQVASLDVLVHASITGEPFGQVVIEGMAASRPVVATAGGGVPEIIEDGISGLLAPMNDAPALAAAMMKLLSDPEFARKIGKGGRARVDSHFTIQQTARRMEQVFAELS